MGCFHCFNMLQEYVRACPNKFTNIISYWYFWRKNHPLNRYPALCPENLGKSDQVTFLGKLLKDGRSPNHNRWTKSECWDVPDQGEGFGDGKVMKMWYTCLICLYESMSLEIIEGNFEKSPTCCKSKVLSTNTTQHNSTQRCDDTKIDGVFFGQARSHVIHPIHLIHPTPPETNFDLFEIHQWEDVLSPRERSLHMLLAPLVVNSRQWSRGHRWHRGRYANDEKSPLEYPTTKGKVPRRKRRAWSQRIG